MVATYEDRDSCGHACALPAHLTCVACDYRRAAAGTMRAFVSASYGTSARIALEGGISTRSLAGCDGPLMHPGTGHALLHKLLGCGSCAALCTHSGKHEVAPASDPRCLFCFFLPIMPRFLCQPCIRSSKRLSSVCPYHRRALSVIPLLRPFKPLSNSSRGLRQAGTTLGIQHRHATPPAKAVLQT